MIIKNIKIESMGCNNYNNGFVRVENGKFIEVGVMNEYAPDGSMEIDGKGLTMYPGFIDAHCHVGMFADGLGFEGDDGNENTDSATPQLRAVDSVNPLDRCFYEGVCGGVTTICTGVGSANPIGGSFVIMNTYGSKRIDKLAVKSPACIKFALGENPKNTYNERNETPVTRMGTAAIIRENLLKTLRYKRDIEEYNRTKGTDDETNLPDYDIKCESLLPLFSEKDKLQAHFHCHRADDIFTAVRIAKEFNLNYVLIHCTEGALIADELAEDKPSVVLGPILSDRSKPELSHSEISTPAVLAENGIKFALCTDHPCTPIQYLPLTAAIAVRGGLSREKALRAITIDAAEILGVSDIIGSIEVGKNADFSLFADDPLNVLNTPEMVCIKGNIAFKKEDFNGIL